MKIVLGSRNPKKKRELLALLGEFTPQIQLLSLEDFPNVAEVEEDEPTFLENAKKKASQYALATKHWALADDSGLSVDFLNGAPGVYSARYAGEPRDQSRNNAKLLEALHGVVQEKRTAHFTCALALSDSQGKIQLNSQAHCHGTILESARGKAGFGYDPLFYYPALQKSFAELSPEEKDRVSHRGLAIREFAEKLRSFLSAKNR